MNKKKNKPYVSKTPRDDIRLKGSSLKRVARLIESRVSENVSRPRPRPVQFISSIQRSPVSNLKKHNQKQILNCSSSEEEETRYEKNMRANPTLQALHFLKQVDRMAKNYAENKKIQA